MKQNFFLYGVFDPAGPCYGRFKNFITKQTPCFVAGSIAQLKSGLMLLDTNGDNKIYGNLVELEMPETGLHVLDALNNYDVKLPKKSLILRKEVHAFLSDSESVSAQAYVLNVDKVKGDISYLRSTANLNLLSDQLSDRQAMYLKKLSNLKGRETIPVDMMIYRELMSMELIVDKGRRIALTPLGTEVCFTL